MSRWASMVLAGAGFFAGCALPAAAAQGYWAGIAEQVTAEIDRAESLAKAGQPNDAKEAVINAYFGLFEELKMEIAERQTLGMERTAQVEALFNDLRKAAGKPGGDVHRLAEPLRQALRADAKALDAARIGPDGQAVAK